MDYFDSLAKKLEEEKLRLVQKKDEAFKSIASSQKVLHLKDELKLLHEDWKKNSLGEKSFLELPFQKILKEKYKGKKGIKLMKYLTRVRENAGARMLEDESFANLFLNNNEFEAVIFSADIRRSTELMLKCESPAVYAEFINTLSSELTEAVKNRYGVYDKFTGDGLLAFFPEFYSGSEGILFALQCAADCQKIFAAVFEAYRDHFDIGEMQTGLGVGIDSGTVFKAGEELEYTVVGKPVVYACRFSAAPAGHTYATVRAKALLESLSDNPAFVEEVRIPIKHENDMTAYDVKLNPTRVPKKPNWA